MYLWRKCQVEKKIKASAAGFLSCLRISKSTIDADQKTRDFKKKLSF